MATTLPTGAVATLRRPCAPDVSPPLVRAMGAGRVRSRLRPSDHPPRLHDLTSPLRLRLNSGGPPATRELVALRAEHGITAQAEVRPASRVDEALARLEQGDVRYRFVIDTTELTHPLRDLGP